MSCLEDITVFEAMGVVFLVVGSVGALFAAMYCIIYCFDNWLP